MSLETLYLVIAIVVLACGVTYIIRSFDGLSLFKKDPKLTLLEQAHQIRTSGWDERIRSDEEKLILKQADEYQASLRQKRTEPDDDDDDVSLLEMVWDYYSGLKPDDQKWVKEQVKRSTHHAASSSSVKDFLARVTKEEPPKPKLSAEPPEL